MATPAEETVVRALETRLASITSANGYDTDVQLVLRYEGQADEVSMYPAIEVYNMGTQYESQIGAVKQIANLTVGLRCLLEGTLNAQLRTSQFVADIRKAIQTDEQLGGVCQYCRVVDSAPFLDPDETEPSAGATVEVQLQFRDTFGDPYTLAT